jgi:hypothetical protein
MIFQRSMSKWLKEWDTNSKFFHKCIKARTSSNVIKALKVEGEWVQTPPLIKVAVVEYFKNQVSSSEWERPRLDDVYFESISEEGNRNLIAPFSLGEIENMVKESEGDKSPGPYGFNFAFFKEFWYLVKNEIRIFFYQFHGNDVLPRGLLLYFFTLIPKLKNPRVLKEFWPILLLGSLYKMLSKVLAARLAK